MSGCLAPSDAATVSGRFLRAGGQRFLVRGVSYGTFAPDADGHQFPPRATVARDFQAIAELEANTVRVYTPPPEWVLDEASRCGLRVIAGVPWIQHLAFLDGQADRRAIRTTIRDEVRRLAPHPATLMVSIGNEIPPSVVRWYGRARIERFLAELYDEAKSVAPDALITYVNYPPTEFLETPFFDVCSFNVFLHSEQALSAYIARLHHIAGARPLLISELGADSLRSGERRQADLIRLQLQTSLREGTCGAVVFSYTDEWWRGGQKVDDWAFGLVDAGRRPKRAYREVQNIFQTSALGHDAGTPKVSVVVCAYNAAATIDECLASLETLNYPDYEVVVVDDGSTDATAEIAGRYPFARVISTPNEGLSSARNVGLHAASGDIVAYTDADVRVDPEWLSYLVRPFLQDPQVAAAGGPAIVPPDDHWFAQCVARAPGSPTHVLLDDRIAEHVPGCNCAFRRDALLAIGGFNPVFLRAGDDVDVCWRIQAQGGLVAFAPAALVWHRHRNTTRAYWRQQVGYGEGETWLAREHPDKFTKGRIIWHGHIYSPLPMLRALRGRRIHAGPFGTAGFPSVYHTDAQPFAYLPHTGRWQLTWVALLALAVILLGAGAPYWRLVLAAATGVLAATVAKCIAYGFRSDVRRLPRIGSHSAAASAAMYRAGIAWLHFIQPFARLTGRVRGYLHRPPAHRKPLPRDDQSVPGERLFHVAEAAWLCLMRPAQKLYWSQRWVEAGDILRATAQRLRQQRAARHIELDSGWWQDRDLSVAERSWFRVDVRALVEDHGGGNCLHRFAVRSRLTRAAVLPILGCIALSVALHYVGLSWAISIAVVAMLASVLAVASVLSTSRLVISALHRASIEYGIAPFAAHTEPDRPIEPLPPPEPVRVPAGSLRGDAPATRPITGDA